MWINPMLSIWLYGTIGGLATLLLSLWFGYVRNSDEDESETDEAF